MTERAIWPAVLVVVIFSSLCCLAQQNATGTQPFGSFAGGPEVINLGNLDVSWDIPILHKQGRGLPFTLTLSKTFTYYDTGNLNTATDVNLAVTTYVYGSGTSCGNSFPTEIDLPLSMTEYATWNCTGGVMLTSKDVNANTTTYKYTDTNYWRLDEVDRPDGGSTTMTYHFGTSSPWYFTQTTAVDSVQSMSIQTNLDGLGRPVKTANLSDPGGYIYQDTVYDRLGRLYSLSNPYHSTGDQTYGVTTYTYDALGRPYVITIPTGNTIQYGYTSRAIKKTEFAGSEDYVTISQMDGLGRTKSVCRLTSVTQANGDAPASCGLDISGTGFNSSYSYDPLGNVTAMCHNAGNCRSFTYDGVSRMLTEKVSEINSITCGGGSYSKCYAYDNVTKGDLSTRTAPKENQSGSATVTTTYTYDQLHRLTEVQYNDGTTPTHWLWYDQSNASAFGWPSTPLPNSKGRLSGTSTLNFTWDAIYGYDSMGRVAVYGTCTIAECQAATPVRFVKNYTYDYAGDLVTGLDNIVGNVTMTPAYNSIGQLKSLSTNCIWINAGSGCASGNVIYNMTYNALGQKIGDTLGFVGRSGHRWAFLAGIAIYAVDMIALIVTFSLWAFGVHAFFVFKWFQAQKALEDLRQPN